MHDGVKQKNPSVVVEQIQLLFFFVIVIDCNALYIVSQINSNNPLCSGASVFV